MRAFTAAAVQVAPAPGPLGAQTVKANLTQLAEQVERCVAATGAELVVLTDRTVYEGERRYLDPHLAVSAVDQALKQFRVEQGEDNLRRRCSIVLRSAALRNVHDVMLALGLGAEAAVDPTAPDAADALRATYASTGFAVLASGATAIAGFAVLAFSDVTMLRDFGIVTVVDLTVSLLGVMAVAPLGEDPRAAFARLRELSETVRTIDPAAVSISAGMSGDLEAAIAEQREALATTGVATEADVTFHALVARAGRTLAGGTRQVGFL